MKRFVVPIALCIAFALGCAMTSAVVSDSNASAGATRCRSWYLIRPPGVGLRATLPDGARSETIVPVGWEPVGAGANDSGAVVVACRAE